MDPKEKACLQLEGTSAKMGKSNEPSLHKTVSERTESYFLTLVLFVYFGAIPSNALGNYWQCLEVHIGCQSSNPRKT